MTAFQKLYKDFLQLLNESFLAEDASLDYITTLSSIHGSSAIVKHLKNPDLQIKSQEFIDIIEGATSLAVIVDTKLEFLSGGGPYLPSLDSNFITDRTVNLPIIHFVSFDENSKIQQIRLNWDQGSLLKLVDVIGKTGRNWPIQHGIDQIKLITSRVGSTNSKNSGTGLEVHEIKNEKQVQENAINPTRDPHASLYLFSPNNETMQGTPSTVVSTRSLAKPQQRDFKELFGDLNLEPESPETSHFNARNRHKKPVDSIANAKNFGPSRLFDTEQAPIISPEKSKNPAKFNHFEFSDGAPNEEKTSPRMPVKTKKHESQWSFDDFMTPQKNVPSKTLCSHDMRHWGTSDDEVMDSPERVKKVDRPRKDIQAHFDFLENDSHDEHYAPIIGRCRGQVHNNGLGLYRELFDEQDGSTIKMQETNIPSHALVKDRRKDFEAHFTLSDKSPGIQPNKKIPQDKAKVVRMMDSNWSSYDQSPTLKENALVSSFTSRNGGSGRPLAESTNILNNKSDVRGGGGIKTDGDGMGGRKGFTRSWDIGDDSDEKQNEFRNPTKYRAGQQVTRAQASSGDFWDF